MANIVVVIPTYNEVENIGRMVDVLVGVEFGKIKDHKMMLLVVDDKSPDGTGKIVSEKMKKHKNLYLLEGEKQGLGVAFTRGFKYAIETLKADAVMEMDGDFQHDPADVKRFVEEFDNGYDYILGSRFIKGGSIPKDWGLYRTFLSVVGNLFIRSILWLWDVHDLTTGYRLARVHGFIDQIDFSKILSKSYAYKIHLLYEMRHRGAKIKEIPIKFISREKGWSKMDSDDFLESLKVVLAIRARSLIS